jgi:hypothetical protein
MTLEEKLQNLPDSPGVDLMKDTKGHLIYISPPPEIFRKEREHLLLQFPCSGTRLDFRPF